MEASLAEYLDHAPVFIRRPSGEILHWTEGCSELYGYTDVEALGRISHELLKTVLPESLEAIEAILSAEGEWSGRLQHTAKSGRKIWAETVWRLRRKSDTGQPIVIEQNTDITTRVELEERSALLARELEHRVKNILAIVQALARMSFTATPDEQRKFDERLVALAEANKLLQDATWREADLRALVIEVARGLGIQDRIRLAGPDVAISSSQTIGLALAVHELCTNALKYGALTRPAGWVELYWTVDALGPQVIHVTWKEHGGPAVVPPSRVGFGTRLIRQAVQGQNGAPVELKFEPAGLVCEMHLVCENDTAGLSA